MSEYNYKDYIERLLVDEYGESNVEREVYLGETYRFVDFLVNAGMVRLAIEVEHSSDKAVEEGVAQSQLYARHNRAWLPVIVYPPDGENERELEMISSYAALVPITHKHE